MLFLPTHPPTYLPTYLSKVNAKGEVFYVVPVPEKELSIFQVIIGKIVMMMLKMMAMT